MPFELYLNNHYRISAFRVIDGDTVDVQVEQEKAAATAIY